MCGMKMLGVHQASTLLFLRMEYLHHIVIVLFILKQFILGQYLFLIVEMHHQSGSFPEIGFKCLK